MVRLFVIICILSIGGYFASILWNTPKKVVALPVNRVVYQKPIVKNIVKRIVKHSKRKTSTDITDDVDTNTTSNIIRSGN